MKLRHGHVRSVRVPEYVARSPITVQEAKRDLSSTMEEVPLRYQTFEQGPPIPQLQGMLYRVHLYQCQTARTVPVIAAQIHTGLTAAVKFLSGLRTSFANYWGSVGVTPHVQKLYQNMATCWDFPALLAHGCLRPQQQQMACFLDLAEQFRHRVSGMQYPDQFPYVQKKWPSAVELERQYKVFHTILRQNAMQPNWKITTAYEVAMVQQVPDKLRALVQHGFQSMSLGRQARRLQVIRCVAGKICGFLYPQDGSLRIWDAVVKVEASSVRRLSFLPHKNASQQIDISLSFPDSGWRAPDPLRQLEIRQDLLAGKLGQSVFRDPQLLVCRDDGKRLLDNKGLVLIGDGLQYISTLMKLRSDKMKGDLALNDERLAKMLDDGTVVCDLVHFQDLETRTIWYCSVHDEENNKYRMTTFAQKLHAVKTAMMKNSDPIQYFVSILGSGCQARIYKWVRAARGMDAEVQEALKSVELAKIPQTYLWDNPYLMGTGTKQKLKLSPDLAMHALNLVLNEALRKTAATRASKAEAKKARPSRRSFQKKVKKVFPSISATALDDRFHETRKTSGGKMFLELFAGAGMVAAAALAAGYGSLALDINEGVDLTATPILDVVVGWCGLAHRATHGVQHAVDAGVVPVHVGQRRSETALGERDIEGMVLALAEGQGTYLEWCWHWPRECHQLHKQLMQQKQADLEQAKKAAKELEEAKEEDVAAETEAMKDHENEPPVLLQGIDVPMEDPVVVAAKAERDAEMAHVQTFRTKEALQDQLMKDTICMRHSILFLIDCASSRLKIHNQYLEDVHAMLVALGWQTLGKLAVVIVRGQRIDLLLKVLKRCEEVFRADLWKVYSVQMTSGEVQQRGRPSIPSFLIVIQRNNGTVPDMPFMVQCLKHRATPAEQHQLRCLSRSCPLRTADEICGLPEVGACPVSEIADDDKEATSNFCDAGPGDDEQDTAVDEQGSEEAQRDYLIDLWPFARPVRFYAQLFRDIVQLPGLTHVVRYPDKPSAIELKVAVRHATMTQEFYTLLDRPREHSVRHGHQIAESYLLKEAMQNEQLKATVQTNKQKRVQDVPYMECAAPSRDSQMIQLLDVAPDSSDAFAGATWRRYQASDDFTNHVDTVPAKLENQMKLRLSQDLEEFGLIVQATSDHGNGLFTSKSIPEGECILKASALLFKSHNTLMEFLQGHASYECDVLRIPGILCHGEVITIWAVLVGAARYVNDFTGVKSRPNARWEINTSQGPNRGEGGLLALWANTRNGVGISSRMEIVSERLGKDNNNELDVGEIPRADPELSESSEKPVLLEEPQKSLSTSEDGTADVAPSSEEKAPVQKPKPEPKSKSRQGNDHEDVLKLEGAVKVCEFPDPECHLLLLEDGSLALQSQCSTNRKLAKHSMLLWIGEGKLGKSSKPLEKALAYQPEKRTVVLDFQSKQVTTLSNMVKASPTITDVLGCKSFPAGAMSGLTSDGTSWYLSGMTELQMKIDVALVTHNIKDVSWVWAFAPSGQRLVPQGRGQASLQSF
ncbi:unnamed protein product [Symbiodinium sp. CCMP2592]|nr:unnamed protein product [Symbiodinium sp. CCMP2592]